MPSSSRDAVVVATARTPIGRAFKGSLKEIRPDDLSVQVLRAVLDKVPALDPQDIDDLYWGCAEPSGRQGANLARVVAVLAGTTSCRGRRSTGSARRADDADGVPRDQGRRGRRVPLRRRRVRLAVPQLGRRRRSGRRGRNLLFGDPMARTVETAKTNATWTDPRANGLLPDVYIAMGQTAENVATSLGISRERQDEGRDQPEPRREGHCQRVLRARDHPGDDAGRPRRVDRRRPRPGVTIEGVSGLNPVFRENGTVTAGNCCPLNDGAAAVVVMSDTKAAELGLTPLARVVATGVSGLSPEIMGLGPIEASRQALARAGMTIGDMDLYEINEAFAAQVLRAPTRSAWTSTGSTSTAGRSRSATRSGRPVRGSRRPC